MDAPRPGIVVMADIYYPSWKVTVDGTPAVLLRADHALRAVAVPAGQHQVRLQFKDATFARGRAISLAAKVVIVLGLAGAAWLGRRRSGLSA